MTICCIKAPKAIGVILKVFVKTNKDVRVLKNE